MANLQLLLNIGAYSDSNPSNAPSLQNFKWNRAINALNANNPKSDAFQIAVSSSVTVFSGTSAKKLVYLEADGPVSVVINGGAARTVSPLIQAGGNFPGMLLSTEQITSLVVTNNSATAVVNLYVASAE